MTKEQKENDRLRFRAYIPDAPHLRDECKDGMFYQDEQYLSSFLRRIYDQYGVNHPSQLSFDIEDRLKQSTGLRDQTGRLIFEGDIVKKDHHDGIYEVKFCKKGYFAGGFRLWNYSSKKWAGFSQDSIWMPSDDPKNFDLVIGNIHQNGDLLND